MLAGRQSNDLSENTLNQDDKFSVVDRRSTTYAIGSADSADAYKNWLRNGIGSGIYYDSTNAQGLKDAYDDIFEKIKEEVKIGSEADWVASDPMPVGGAQGIDAIEFIGLYDREDRGYPSSLTGSNTEDGENTASFDAQKQAISWDLKSSGYATSVSGNTTTYTYTLKYRVRLRNEDAGFEERKSYDTNDKTTLSYRVVESKNGEMKVSDQKKLDFPIPAVEGYLSELTFTKQDSRGDPLAGAEFTLSHSDTCGYCRGDNQASVEVKDQVRSSGTDGKVTFTNIPSGHTYTLTETKVPPGYAASGNTYTVQVAYDRISVTVRDLSGNVSVWTQTEDGTAWSTGGVIVNNTYYELPSTGGPGTMWFTVGGLALLLAAGCGLYQIKHKRRKEDRASF